MDVRLQVNKLKGQEYQLLWREQPDFVRMAAKLNALIIPFAAVGGESPFLLFNGRGRAIRCFGNLQLVAQNVGECSRYEWTKTIQSFFCYPGKVFDL